MKGQNIQIFKAILTTNNKVELQNILQPAAHF